MAARRPKSGSSDGASGREGPLPIQPVPTPILCNPYDEPDWHWLYNTETGAATKTEGRRDASYWFRAERTSTGQVSMFAQEESDPLELVNALRDDVRRWRASEWEGATPVTKQLLRYWTRADRSRRLFFCQREAVETIIYVTEVLGAGRAPRFTPRLSLDDFGRLRRGERVSFVAEDRVGRYASLVDVPNDADLQPLYRYGCKMATGSGKTIVMAMIVAWSFCNRGRVPGNDRFPNAALIVCPNLTIKERLQVLRPEHEANYYEEFDLVPSSLMSELRKGALLVTNWHAFAPESEHAEGGKTYAVVNKGEESNEAFAKRVLDRLAERGRILVLNDEAHHAYRPAPATNEQLSRDERAEREEATVWIAGLDRINAAIGVQSCIDLSATPFYLHGSGYAEGSPFPWLVSDFGLVDAIESGIVKIPRIPVSDTTGRPEPKYFALWRHITDRLSAGEKLPGGKPKPEVVWRNAEDALATLASQWVERFERSTAAKPGQEVVPPVLIIVCDNTEIAELYYERISGERVVPIGADDQIDDDDDDAPVPAPRGKKPKTKILYGQSKFFPGFFANTPTEKRTLRIDSRLLAEAESSAGTSRKDAAELLREVVASVGKRGMPGERVRCVVSVQMLSEGWDANNVTHILGLRAFGSQLLCEQVVGRGLRRMDYTPDPATGRLTEEYVDVYGVPFSVIPFKGRESGTATPEDAPKNHVQSLPERAQYAIRFPIVEGYVVALRSNLVHADVDAVEPIVLEPDQNPTAVYVKPQVSHRIGAPGAGFEQELQDRQAYYESTHLQTIKFEIAREVVRQLTEAGGSSAKLSLTSRHQLFPQVYRIVEQYVDRRISARGCDMRELGLQTYMERTVERLLAAIEPDADSGEPPLLPLLNRSRPMGDTARVGFKTVRPCVPTTKSQIDQVVADTGSWEQAAVFRLEQSPLVAAYARNDHLELSIPYDYLGTSSAYFPDFVVRLTTGRLVLLEIKGEEDERDRMKHQFARRWISAVNRWGRAGEWRLLVCRDPQQLGEMLKGAAAG